ncbi:hypothetical protein ACRAWF_45935 [Streptomyces sp. L7]
MIIAQNADSPTALKMVADSLPIYKKYCPGCRGHGQADHRLDAGPAGLEGEFQRPEQPERHLLLHRVRGQPPGHPPGRPAVGAFLGHLRVHGGRFGERSGPDQDRFGQGRRCRGPALHGLRRDRRAPAHDDQVRAH